LPSVDPVDEQYVGEGRELGHTTDEREALQFSEQMTGAVPTWAPYRSTSTAPHCDTWACSPAGQAGDSLPTSSSS
jgi:hypothetical protein